MHGSTPLFNILEVDNARFESEIWFVIVQGIGRFNKKLRY